MNVDNGVIIDWDKDKPAPLGHVLLSGDQHKVLAKTQVGERKRRLKQLIRAERKTTFNADKIAKLNKQLQSLG